MMNKEIKKILNSSMGINVPFLIHGGKDSFQLMNDSKLDISNKIQNISFLTMLSSMVEENNNKSDEYIKASESKNMKRTENKKSKRKRKNEKKK